MTIIHHLDSSRQPTPETKASPDLGHRFVHDYTTANVTDPRLTGTDSNLAEEAKQREFREALTSFMTKQYGPMDLCVELEPVADFFLTKQHNNKAAVCYLIMLEGRPLVPKFYNNCSLAYLRMDDAKTAYALATRSALIKADNKQAYSLQGLALKKLKSYALACVAYAKVLELDPTDEKGQLGYKICEALFQQYPTQTGDSILR